MKNKVEIVPEAPQLSSREAARYKDFDGLMNQYNDYGRVLRRNRIVGSTVFGVLALLMVLVYLQADFNASPGQTPTPGTADFGGNSSVGPELPDTSPLLHLAEPGEISEQKKKQKEEKAQPAAPLAEDVDRQTTDHFREKQEQGNDSKPINEFTEAAPVNGMQHLYEWLNEHIVYPEEVKAALDSAADLQEKPVDGVVVVQFTVEADSSISHVKVVQSLGESFDREAIRLIKSMPPWKPASRNGQPVSRTFTLPVRFSVLKMSSHDL